MGIFLDTINGKHVHRAPVMTKIWLDLASNLTGRDRLALFADSTAAAKTILDAAMLTENDCARLFLFAPRQIEVTEKGAFHVRNGRSIGKIDVCGGCATLLDNPADMDLSDPYTAVHYNSYINITYLNVKCKYFFIKFILKNNIAKSCSLQLVVSPVKELSGSVFLGISKDFLGISLFKNHSAIHEYNS